MDLRHLYNLTDLELVERYNEGETSAGEMFFKRYQEFLEQLSKDTIHHSSLNSQDKKSLVYTTFLRAFPKYTMRNGASFRTYLKRCVKNAFLNEMRNRKAKKRAPQEEVLPIDDEEVKRDLERRLAEFWERSQRDFIRGIKKR